MNNFLIHKSVLNMLALQNCPLITRALNASGQAKTLLDPGSGVRMYISHLSVTFLPQFLAYLRVENLVSILYISAKRNRTAFADS